MGFSPFSKRAGADRVETYEARLAKGRAAAADDSLMTLDEYEGWQLRTGMRQVMTSEPIGEVGGDEHAETRPQVMLAVGGGLVLLLGLLFVLGVL